MLKIKSNLKIEHNDNTHCYHFKCCSPFLSSLKYDTMHQRLNAIVMKAIWNIEKRQGRVTIQELVEENKEEYREKNIIWVRGNELFI